MYEADNRDRTGGLRITSASLYLLSHIGRQVNYSKDISKNQYLFANPFIFTILSFFVYNVSFTIFKKSLHYFQIHVTVNLSFIQAHFVHDFQNISIVYVVFYHKGAYL